MRTLFSLLLCCSTAALAEGDGGLAQGWYVSGKQVSAYAVGATDRGACGGRAATVASRAAGVKGPLAVMQTFRADDYRGARVRFSAVVDVRKVTGWAGLFFRADGAQHRTLVFDDMSPRPLRGDQPCARVFVVAAVPPEAELLSLGVTLHGEGEVELSEVSLERVGDDVPLTSGLDHAHGRVDDVWFTDVKIDGNPGRKEMQHLELERRAPGLWGDGSEAEVVLENGRVSAHLFRMLTGSTPMTYSGEFTISQARGVTTIKGQWGTASASYPLEVTYDRNRVDTKWGFYERHLVAEPAPHIRDGCVFFAERSANGYADALELCGAVFSPTPPPAQTVMAFLLAGFRRIGTGLPQSSPGLRRK